MPARFTPSLTHLASSSKPTQSTCALVSNARPNTSPSTQTARCPPSSTATPSCGSRTRSCVTSPARATPSSGRSLWESNHLTNTLNVLFGQKFFSGGNPDQKVVERATKDFRKHAKVLDAHLANNTYVTGDTLTLADFSVGVAFGYAVPLELPLEGLDNINRWWTAFSATDSGAILLPG
ncbi:MAG: glutathione S-transferase domain-containing protein [Deltaproteobacteria bacterium]|nr:glutathione S-transferase domain-containing protein [Deltaproteobacteria bacterium]